MRNFSSFRETNLVKSFCTFQFVFLSLYHSGHDLKTRCSQIILGRIDVAVRVVFFRMYYRLFRESILFHLNETKKGSLRSEISDINPFLTQFNSKNKNHFVRSRYLVSKERCIAHRNFVIPQRNSFYEENVSIKLNVMIVLFSA